MLLGMRAILWGGLLAGALDISAAFVTWGVRGISPVRILQSIARGLLGPPAMQGGLATAALGLVLHFIIAFGAAAAYWAASQRMGVLARRGVELGMLYGIAVFAFMNWVVIPLSAAPPQRFTSSSLAIAILTHMFCVGLPIGWTVRGFGEEQVARAAA
jgi:uncharacterized membrane protein YagU involved in acid resistance